MSALVPRDPAWRRYLRFLGPDPDADVDDELRAHIEMRIEDNLARGLSPDEARREALHRFGDVARFRAECRSIDHQWERSVGRTELWDALRQDLRYALRTLARSPGFALVAITSLGLGIGANVTIFGLVDSLVLRPLPGITRPETLVELEGTTKSYPTYRLVRDELGLFDDVAAYRTREMSLSLGDGATIIDGGIVSGNYFDLLGTRPALGRTFAAEEDRPGARIAVTVLGHGLWVRAFGADSGVLGRTIRINGAPFTVIGVAPRGFRGTRIALAPDLWIPIAASPLVAVGEIARLDIEKPGWGWLMAVARSKPGVTMAEAQRRLRELGERQTAADAVLARELTDARVVPATSAAASTGDGPSAGAFALLMLGVVGLTLLIACANVAGLLLARAARRGKEISVRLALGAGRGRLVRQLLTESLVIGMAGAVAGLAIAAIAVPLVSSITIPGAGTIELMGGGLSGRMLLVAAVLGLVCSMVFGSIPALQASRPSLVPALKDLGEGARLSRGRMRSGVIVAQLALSLVLLAGAGLFLRSLGAAITTETGYASERIAVALVIVGFERYDAARADRLYADIAERLASRPGVHSASWANMLPLTGNREVLTFRVPDPGADTLQRVTLSAHAVGPRYLTTMGVPIVRGREITEADDRTRPLVGVVNETMARRYWPAGDALGARLRLGLDEVTVVGIARDARYVELDEDPRPHIYLSALQASNGLTDQAVIVARTSGDPAALVPAVRGEVRALDPQIPVTEATTFEHVIAQLVLPQRIVAGLLGILGVLTLVLAAVGVYGVMAYLVAQRTRELGIRLALGATRTAVLRLVMTRSAVLVGAGIVIGLALAIAGARVVASFLYGIGATDPVAFAGSTVLLALAALAATLIPASRATRIAPTEALRAD